MKQAPLAAGGTSPLDLTTVRSQRRAGTRRFVAAILALSLGLVVSVALATGIGRMDIGWQTVAEVILGKLGFPTPSGGWNLPLRRLGGTTASMASSFSVGSART